MKKSYQGMQDKSKRKFEVLGKRELLAEVPLPMVEVWEELQAQVEQLAGEAGLRIFGTILENEVTRRVGPPHRPDPMSGAVRWWRQPGYVIVGGRSTTRSGHTRRPATDRRRRQRSRRKWRLSGRLRPPARRHLHPCRMRLCCRLSHSPRYKKSV